jgi:hypothetical protein
LNGSVSHPFFFDLSFVLFVSFFFSVFISPPDPHSSCIFVLIDVKVNYFVSTKNKQDTTFFNKNTLLLYLLSQCFHHYFSSTKCLGRKKRSVPKLEAQASKRLHQHVIKRQ